MRSRDPKLMKQIHDYINEFYIAEERTPTTTEIASAFSISRSSAYRYLVYLSENHDIAYEKGEIRTSKMNRINLNGSRAAIVGSIPCGEATSEEECVEEYVKLPESLFGSGEFYILRARGDSMEDAGIHEKDLVVIQKQETAKVGDIVVALIGDNENTLKRFGGLDGEGYAILEYQNEEVYPEKIIRVRDLIVQGVAKHVIRSL